jgi:PucR family transcriptional regulator, purine catabolism regulatory protein
VPLEGQALLTVREALAMPVFAAAEVVAGHEGLDNEIRWVHIVDIPEAHYEWGRRGVLLLTAGFGLKDFPERQAALIPKLVKEGFAGLVLSAGYYFEKTPDVMRQAADELQFPIIETPRDVLFIDLTEAIFEQIVNRQYALLHKSAGIHQQLTDLVLKGGDLNALATTLATILERSITIEDPSFSVLANAQYGAIDEARRRSVSYGRTTPEVADRLLEAGIYEQLLARMRPLRVPPMPDQEMVMERIVAPIIVDRVIHGYMWIIAGERPLTELDELAIEHGATVAALIMFKEEAVREAAEALRGDFFDRLLRGAPWSTAVAEQARQLNFRLNQPQQVLLLHGKAQAGGNERPLLAAVDQWFQRRREQPLLVWREEGLVVVIESDRLERGKEVAGGLVQELSHPVRRLLVGVGNVYRPAGGESNGVQTSYEQAREAVQVSLALGSGEGVFTFHELGLLHWLYRLPPEARAGNVYLEQVQKLAAYDAEKNSELVKTLEMYLDHGGALVESAELLFVHRNTLLHRISRIEALCNVNLRDPMQRLNLHAAVKSYRLFAGKA